MGLPHPRSRYPGTSSGFRLNFGRKFSTFGASIGGSSHNVEEDILCHPDCGGGDNNLVSVCDLDWSLLSLFHPSFQGRPKRCNIDNTSGRMGTYFQFPRLCCPEAQRGIPGNGVVEADEDRQATVATTNNDQAAVHRLGISEISP